MSLTGVDFQLVDELYLTLASALIEKALLDSSVTRLHLLDRRLARLGMRLIPQWGHIE